MSAPANEAPKLPRGFTALQKCTHPSGCETAMKVRGLCWRHYKQAYRNGGAMAPSSITPGVPRHQMKLHLKRELWKKLKERASALGLKPSALATRWIAEALK